MRVRGRRKAEMGQGCGDAIALLVRVRVFNFEEKRVDAATITNPSQKGAFRTIQCFPHCTLFIFKNDYTH